MKAIFSLLVLALAAFVVQVLPQDIPQQVLCHTEVSSVQQIDTEHVQGEARQRE
jgi:hypothetical protein